MYFQYCKKTFSWVFFSPLIYLFICFFKSNFNFRGIGETVLIREGQCVFSFFAEKTVSFKKLLTLSLSPLTLQL